MTLEVDVTAERYWTKAGHILEDLDNDTPDLMSVSDSSDEDSQMPDLVSVSDFYEGSSDSENDNLGEWAIAVHGMYKSHEVTSL